MPNLRSAMLRFYRSTVRNYSPGLGSGRSWVPGRDAARRYSEGGTPTWFRKKRVKLLCAEKPSSAETSAILPCPDDRREIAVSTQSMSREARGEKPVHIGNRS